MRTSWLLQSETTFKIKILQVFRKESPFADSVGRENTSPGREAAGGL
jgi:hypothetical protein